MKKKELLELLERLDDDFEIVFRYSKPLREDEIDPSYLFPFEIIDLKNDGYDIGYSSKKLILCLEEHD